MRVLTISFLVILLTSCSTQDSKSIRDDLKYLAEKHQTFIIENTKPDTIITKNGTALLIPKNSFRFKDGKTVDDSIQIDVIEVFTKSDMILNGVSTTSQGRLIESFGMVKITAQSNGQGLFIRDSASIVLAIPSKRGIIGGELFYGQEVNENSVDWTYAGKEDSLEVIETIMPLPNGMASVKRTTFKLVDGQREYVSDTVFTTKYLEESDFRGDEVFDAPKYHEFEIKNLGWINCDRFIDIEEKTALSVELKKYSQPVGYIVFTSINSVMNLVFDEKGVASSDNLPNDYEVEVIIIDKMKDKMVFARQRLQIGKVKSIQVEPKQIDAIGLKSELERLDK